MVVIGYYGQLSLDKNILIIFFPVFLTKNPLAEVSFYQNLNFKTISN